MEVQFSTLELAWFAMEKIDECHPAGRDPLLCVIGVRTEEVAIIAGRDLHLRMTDRKLFHPQLLQHTRQHTPNPVQDNFLMRTHVHQDFRTAMAVIGDAWVSAGRNHFAASKVCLTLQRVLDKFVQLLWSQELV